MLRDVNAFESELQSVIDADREMYLDLDKYKDTAEHGYLRGRLAAFGAVKAMLSRHIERQAKEAEYASDAMARMVGRAIDS